MDERLIQVVLGGHAGLRSVDDDNPAPIYDWAHMSYAWGRRENLYRQLRSMGFTMAPNGFGVERHETLRRTRLMVNAQQYTLPIIAPLRFAVAAAYRLPIVSEALAQPYPHIAGQDFIGADYSALPQLVKETLADETLCVKWTFRRGVEDGIAASERLVT